MVKHINHSSKHIKSRYYDHKSNFAPPRVLSLPHKYYIEKYRTSGDMRYNNIYSDYVPHKYNIDHRNHIHRWMIPITTHNYGGTYINPCENGGLLVASDHGRNICICPYEYMGTNCQDINYCHPDPCMNGGKCQVTRFGTHYQCDCYKEHLGARCERTNPCFPNPCRNNGECTHNGVNATCICTNGFKGSRCEEVNSCIPNPCLNGAICYEKPGLGKFECICEADWRGTICNQPTPCSTFPCLNGGKCVDTADSYKCLCNDGLIGRHCEIELCSPNPCKNYGKCFQDGKTFKCLCPEWTKGELCEVLSPCKLHPCQNHAVCIDSTSIYQWNFTPAHYYCKCQSSWTGEHCQVSKCKACHIHAICDGEKCVCEQGYSGNGLVCTKLETPCAPNPCENSGICHDEGNGNFHCVCKLGFKPPLCKDTDLCNPNTCNGGVCSLTLDGGFKCTSCPPGFFGVTCRQNDSCFSNPCQHGGHCRLSSLGNHICDCVGFWSGEVCEKCSCPFSMNPLVPSPYCLLTTGQCVCPGHYVWESKQNRCILPKAEIIDPCLSSPCLCGGTCIWDNRDTSEYTCLCNERCYGPRCEFENACQRDRPCYNGGNCTNLFGGKYKCHCYFGYSGVNCQIAPIKPVNRCDINVCLNGGICKPLNYGYDCICLPRYTGIHCQVDRCRDCDIHAKCVHGVCKCLPGWVGNGYECVKEECDSKCVGFQTCISGVCGCLPGYTIVQNICMRERKSTKEPLSGSFAPRTMSSFDHMLSTTRKPLTILHKTLVATTVTHQPTIGLPITYYLSTVSSNLPATTRLPSIEYYDNNTPPGFKHSLNIGVENGLSKTHVFMKQNISEVTLKHTNNSLKGVSNFAKTSFLKKNEKNVYPDQSKKDIKEKVYKSGNVKRNLLQNVDKNEMKYLQDGITHNFNKRIKYANKVSSNKTIVQQSSWLRKVKDFNIRKNLASIFTNSKNVNSTNIVVIRKKPFLKNLNETKIASKQSIKSGNHFSKSINASKHSEITYYYYPINSFDDLRTNMKEAGQYGEDLRTNMKEAGQFGEDLRTNMKEANQYREDLCTNMKEAGQYGEDLCKNIKEAGQYGEDLRTNMKEAGQYGEDLRTNMKEAGQYGEDLRTNMKEAGQYGEDLRTNMKEAGQYGEDSESFNGQMNNPLGSEVNQDRKFILDSFHYPNSFLFDYPTEQKSTDLHMSNESLSSFIKQESMDISKIRADQLKYVDNDIESELPQGDNMQYFNSNSEGVYIPIYSHDVPVLHNTKKLKNLNGPNLNGSNLNGSVTNNMTTNVFSFKQDKIGDKGGLEHEISNIKNENLSASKGFNKQQSAINSDKDFPDDDLQKWLKEAKVLYAKGIKILRKKGLLEEKQSYSSRAQKRKLNSLSNYKNNVSNFSIEDIYPDSLYPDSLDDFTDNQSYPDENLFYDFSDQSYPEVNFSSKHSSLLARLPGNDDSTLVISSSKDDSLYKTKFNESFQGKPHAFKKPEEKFESNNKTSYNKESFFAKLITLDKANKQINLSGQNEEIIPSKIFSNRFQIIKHFDKMFSYVNETKNSQNDTKINVDESRLLQNDLKNNTEEVRNKKNDAKSDAGQMQNLQKDIKNNTDEIWNSHNNTKNIVDEDKNTQLQKNDTKNITRDQPDHIDHSFEANSDMFENQKTEKNILNVSENRKAKETIFNMSENHGTNGLIENFFDNNEGHVISLRGIAKSNIPNNRIVLKSPIYLKKTKLKPLIKVQPIDNIKKISSFLKQSLVKIESKMNIKNLLRGNKTNRYLSLSTDQHNSSNKFTAVSVPFKVKKILSNANKNFNREFMNKTVEVSDVLKEYGITKNDLVAETNK
ncbi:uncharacterized protein LOC101237995 isoform X4 [Hydra vulgaris]